MRWDIRLDNDAGALAVLPAEAGDDETRAVIAELPGDDSAPVRIVVAEPLTAAEQDRWLSRISGGIETVSGRVLVTAGFDPDVFGDERHTAVVGLEPGPWRVDLYAYPGSMLGDGEGLGYLVHLQPGAGRGNGWSTFPAIRVPPEAAPVPAAPERRPPRPAEPVGEDVPVWEGAGPSPVDAPVTLPAGRAFHLYWLVALAADESPRFALGGRGAPASARGWERWWAIRALAPPGDGPLSLVLDGRACFTGTVTGGVWTITHAAPPVPGPVLREGLDWVATLLDAGAIVLTSAAEQQAFERAAGRILASVDELVVERDRIRLREPSERTLLFLATAVAGVRFGAHWPED